MKLWLLDGSIASSITQICSLPVTFPTGEIIPLDFYLTPLDSACKAILGYSFLSRYNPLVDWAEGKITFHHTEQHVSPPSSPPFKSAVVDDGDPILVSIPSNPASKPSRQNKFPFEPIYTYPSLHGMGAQVQDTHIAVIGAAAFLRCCSESQQEPLALYPIPLEPEIAMKGSSAVPENIHPELTDFADVFDEGLSDKLAPHHPYDLKIELLEGAEPPIGWIYPVSDSELASL